MAYITGGEGRVAIGAGTALFDLHFWLLLSALLVRVHHAVAIGRLATLSSNAEVKIMDHGTREQIRFRKIN